MPIETSPRKDRAVAMVMAGKASAKDAADAVGLGPEAVQGIRKRARLERALGEEQRVAAEEEGRLRTAKKKRSGPATDGPPTKKKKRWKKTTHQVDLDNEDDLVCRKATADAYAKATAEYKVLLCGAGGKRKRCGGGGAEAIANKFNADLPDGATPLTAQTIRERVHKGKAGESVASDRGPDRKLPAEFYDTIASYIQMKQESGDEAKPKGISRAIRAALKGTKWEVETDRQIKTILQHVREDFADEISRANKVHASARTRIFSLREKSAWQ